MLFVFVVLVLSCLVLFCSPSQLSEWRLYGFSFLSAVASSPASDEYFESFHPSGSLVYPRTYLLFIFFVVRFEFSSEDRKRPYPMPPLVLVTRRQDSFCHWSSVARLTPVELVFKSCLRLQRCFLGRRKGGGGPTGRIVERICFWRWKFCVRGRMDG